MADLLRMLGPLDHAEVAARAGRRRRRGARRWLRRARGARAGAIRVRIGGEERWAAVEDAGRLRDALGTPLPVGVAEAFTEPVPDPLGDLLARYARTHGPFAAAGAAARFGLGVAVVTEALRRLAAGGRLVEGELRPLEAGGVGVGVVRRRGAADAPAPLAGRAAGGGRAGAGRAISRASCPSWQGVGGAGCAASTGCSARSSSSPGRSCPPARWRRSCSRRGCPATARRCSTS